ncbi:Na+/H+ antiporter NhaA [Paraburkholderia humisilvae]|uniref:Na(+)/H(+) antiporter NhaA n=1 Tax=Paraburkholderia humisilvae TaxID=627669 RepID=A0A6J5FB59_9BURK|nr:Na+/H+ antiporter NhaA [Paraburkholderia humisilvae]CAB3774455.1 Na(+)/H(+) antiporter NhaA [Paraburkholderia humisilvae]
MQKKQSASKLSSRQSIARKAFTALEHFLRVEAASGILLMASAAIALVWGNSSFAPGYQKIWELPLTIGAGEFVFTRSLHFWINDALMTVFFLVVGMEIRREIHEGSLSDIRQAVLPLAAAIGGVAAPALIYIAANHTSDTLRGWAVPTATDIAFAVGVLALLGRSVPSSVRIFLLTLAIVDDIIAVLIIAFFYSSGLNYDGFIVAAAGIAVVFLMQRLNIGTAPAYIAPGVVIWTGLLISGAHPTLAGIALGLMVPVTPRYTRERVVAELSRATNDLVAPDVALVGDVDHLTRPLQTLRLAQRGLLPPVLRVQHALHPWVAFGVMPLFALANAGVTLRGIDLSRSEMLSLMAGITVALTVGKPLGVFCVTWLLIKLKLCRLPDGISWGGVRLIALLAGIGFTMSIFIATLAFKEEIALNVAKLAVLLGSLTAGILGLALGALQSRRRKK